MPGPRLDRGVECRRALHLLHLCRHRNGLRGRGILAELGRSCPTSGPNTAHPIRAVRHGLLRRPEWPRRRVAVDARCRRCHLRVVESRPTRRPAPAPGDGIVASTERRNRPCFRRGTNTRTRRCALHTRSWLRHRPATRRPEPRRRCHRRGRAPAREVRRHLDPTNRKSCGGCATGQWRHRVSRRHRQRRGPPTRRSSTRSPVCSTT